VSFGCARGRHRTATGLGKGSLYGAFGDKHQLFLRVFDDYCAGVTEAVRRALAGPNDEAYERLRAHVLAVADAPHATGVHERRQTGPALEDVSETNARIPFTDLYTESYDGDVAGE
jgi:AcrR family transcriptional regulator